MLFMVIETYRGGAERIYRRLAEQGRMLPEGVRYVGSWVDVPRTRCFQLMECADAGRLQGWMDRWKDLVDFAVVPVTTSADAAAAAAPSAEPAGGDDEPLPIFLRWYDEAVACGEPLPDAAALATATPSGEPSVRMVLYRGISAGGLRFFTSFMSRKAGELEANPRAALAFHWPSLGRQLRVEGLVERLADAESDAYFASRPREHQLSALASPQSRPIPHRDWLVARRAEVARAHEGRTVSRPASWGGYRLLPRRIEFWTRGEDRLHERQLWEWRDARWETSWLGP